MIQRLLDFLFGCGCAHQRTTFPQSIKDGPAHVTCLSCARSFEYDWSTMRIGDQLPPVPYNARAEASGSNARLVASANVVEIEPKRRRRKGTV